MASQISHGVLLKEIAAAAMMMAHALDWREGIDVLLGRLGRAAQVSRVYLFEIGTTEDGSLTQGCFHDWAATGLDRLATEARYQREIVEGYDPVFETWIERRRRGELIRGHTRDLTGPLREDFDYQRIQSFMSMPIQVNGEWWGHLGFDDCVRERDWSEEEVHLLQTTAALIGASAMRDDAKQRLHRLEAMRAAMTDVALDAIIILDGEGLARDFNPAAETIFQRSRADVIGRPIADLIVPERLRLSHEQGFRAANKNRHLRSPAIRHELVAIRSDGSEFPVELALVQIKQGQDLLYAGFIRDLTERRAVEQRMRGAERERSNLARFFPPHVVEHMISIEQPLSVDNLQPATVLFADMIGFTTFCSENAPRTVIDTLRELLRHLCEQVFANEGTVDKFTGDGLMAVFGSPTPGPRDATNAVRCALAMQRAVASWNAERKSASPIRIAIGIHTGNVILGDIGSERRLEFAVLGDTVNVASRVEGKCRSLDASILFTDDVLSAVRAEDGADAIAGHLDLGLQELRGRTTAVHLYGWKAE